MKKDKNINVVHKHSLEAIKYKRNKYQNHTSPEQQYETNIAKRDSQKNQIKPSKFQSKKIKPEFILYNKMNQKLEALQSQIEQIKANIHRKNLQRMKRNVLKNQQLQQQKKKIIDKLQNQQKLIKKQFTNIKTFSNNQNRTSQNLNLVNKSKQLKEQQIKNSNSVTNDTKPSLNQFITQQNSFNKNIKIPQALSISSLVTSMPESNGHTFDFNPYSPRSSIYYVSEVIKGYKDKQSLVYQHLKTSIFLFNYFSHIRMPLNTQVQKRMLNLTIKSGYQGKKTIIFDLDQTLIHCTQNMNQKHEIQLPITFPNGTLINAGINVRPGVKAILEALYQDFQLIVFTASHNCYANVVIDHIDPQKKYIQHRLYREHCHVTVNGQYVKDLRIINRELKNMVLVDNAAYSYAFQPQNGVPIIPYYHGQKDFQLKALTNYIQKLQNCSDVRLQNRKTFKLLKYRDYKPNQVQKLVNDLYIEKKQ